MTVATRRQDASELIDRKDDAGHSLFRLLKLRKDTARPLYQQLEEQIVALISEGRIEKGEALPAERQLAQALGISRATVQHCYGALRQRQLIRGSGRHGSIVEGEVAKLIPGMDRLKGFTQEMHELGRVPSTRVLEQEIVADRSMASLFGLHSNARFLHLVRVRCGDDMPLSFERAWYSLDAAPFLENADPLTSIYGQLAAQGLALHHCDQTIEATSPTPRECAIFGFEDPVPCLLIKRQSYLRGGTMVEYVEGLFRGDSYTYRLKLDA